MGIFSRKYLYVEVCFLHGNRPYSYRANDRSIKVNDVVMVHAGDMIKPAIVASVHTYAEKDVLYPLNLTKEVISKADRANRKLFKGVDMRMPLDISTKSVPTTSGHATVVTDKAERQMVRQKLSGNKGIKVVESQPVSKAGRIVSRDDKGKRNKVDIGRNRSISSEKSPTNARSARVAIQGRRRPVRTVMPKCGKQNTIRYESMKWNFTIKNIDKKNKSVITAGTIERKSI